jgi:Mrp family chromosome partitioning ATPase
MAKNECNNECSNECECNGECNNESETENNAGKILNNVKNVIAVMSGKGGVGKSLVSGLTAMALRQRGFTVGIMDADITGPSIPTIFGTKERPIVTDKAMVPVQSKTGIKIMSINLLLQNENDAVIWRGPIIGKVIQQFWSDVQWGNLDYLIVDLPPGTADAPLTVLASLPVNGIIIVFTPQELTAMVVRKAINMAQTMNKKILGVVENMSYLYIPEINKKMEIFGKSHGKEMAAQIGVPLLAQIPIDPDLVKRCDKGEIEKYNSPAYKTFAENLVKVLREEKPAKAD